MRKIKKGDSVVVSPAATRASGATSRCVVDDRHVIVNGVNQVKKHAKPNPLKNQPGGIVSKEMPIDVSNVAIWNPVTQKPDRVGMRVLEDGRKVRFFKSNGEQLA